MTYDQADKLLKKNGYVLECWSPLEIGVSIDTTDRASGVFAEMIITYLEESESKKKKKKKHAH